MPEPVSHADTIRTALTFTDAHSERYALAALDALLAVGERDKAELSGLRVEFGEWVKAIHEAFAEREVDPQSDGPGRIRRLVLERQQAEERGERDRRQIATPQFLDDIRAVVRDHWSGLPEHRPDESVWARLDAVLYDEAGQPREHPDYTADPLAAVLAGEEDAANG